MKKQLIPLSKGKRRLVVQHCAGDLTVRPIDEDVVRLKGDDFEIDEIADGFVISSQGDLAVYLFPDTTFELKEGLGNVRIKATTASISLEQVHGDLTLAHSQGAAIGRAFGNLVAKHLHGDLTVDLVNGNAVVQHCRAFSAREIHGGLRVKHTVGDVTVEQILGDCSFNYIDGSVTVLNALHDVSLNRINGILEVTTQGDIRLKYPLTEGKHQLEAGQDIVLLWPDNQPISISAEAARLTNRLEFDHAEHQEQLFTAHNGEGGPYLQIKAGASLILKPSQQEWADENEFGFQFDIDFGREIEAFGSRMANMGEEIASKVTRKMAEITSQLEGQFKAMRKKEEAVRRASERMSRYAPTPPAPPTAPASPSREINQQAVDDAKLKVLEILEQGKITVEEANTLLKALE